MLHKALVNEIRRGDYEFAGEKGLYLPKSRMFVGGVFNNTKRSPEGDVLDFWTSENLVLNAGIQYIFNEIFGDSSLGYSWYVGLYGNAYTPQAADTSADIGVSYTEVNAAYDEATRPAYTSDGALSGADLTMSNSASKATFTFNTNSTTVAGAYVISTNTKASATGVMLAASKYATSKSMDDGETLDVGYDITGSSS